MKIRTSIPNFWKRSCQVVLLLIVTLMLTMAMASCKGTLSGDENRVKKSNEKKAMKLLKVIHHDEGVDTEFEYDDKKRIVKVSTIFPREEDEELNSFAVFNYIGDDLLEGFERKGNTITVIETNTTFTIDKAGHMIKRVDAPTDNSSGSEEIFEFQDGNMIKYTGIYSFGTAVRTVKYDDKYSIYNCNTPNWIFTYSPYLPFANNGSKNNEIEGTSTSAFDGSVAHGSYNYTYDDDGYPTYVEWGNEYGDSWYASFEYFETE